MSENTKRKRNFSGDKLSKLKKEMDKENQKSLNDTGTHTSKVEIAINDKDKVESVDTDGEYFKIGDNKEINKVEPVLNKKDEFIKNDLERVEKIEIKKNTIDIGVKRIVEKEKYDELVEKYLNEEPSEYGRSTKEQLNLLTSPYFASFMKHMAYKANDGKVGKKGSKASLTRVLEIEIVLYFIKSGRMKKMIKEDDILETLYRKMLIDLNIDEEEILK